MTWNKLIRFEANILFLKSDFPQSTKHKNFFFLYFKYPFQFLVVTGYTHSKSGED